MPRGDRDGDGDGDGDGDSPETGETGEDPGAQPNDGGCECRAGEGDSNRGLLGTSGLLVLLTLIRRRERG